MLIQSISFDDRFTETDAERRPASGRSHAGEGNAPLVFNVERQEEQ
jgi:hypothetical protein